VALINNMLLPFFPLGKEAHSCDDNFVGASRQPPVYDQKEESGAHSATCELVVLRARESKPCFCGGVAVHHCSFFLLCWRPVPLLSNVEVVDVTASDDDSTSDRQPDKISLVVALTLVAMIGGGHSGLWR